MRMHRKIFALLLALLTLGAAPAFAAAVGSGTGGYSGPGGPGGYSGPGPGLVTAAQAKGMSDDAWVTLKGHIVRGLGGEHYEFKDASGTITLEIDAKRWRGLTVGADDLVEVSGKIDKDLFDMEVEVKQIIKR